MAFQGVIFDIVDEVVVELCPIERATREEAMADARELCAHVNANSDDYNGREADPDVDAYVKVVGGEIEY